jgi:DNA-binding NarL/FixJ family response regulator
MSAGIAFKALKLLRHASLPDTDTEQFQLTRRETEILEQLCAGLNYQHIADNLVISPKTVRKHIENVYHKLNVHSKVEAVNVARRNRLI